MTNTARKITPNNFQAPARTASTFKPKTAAKPEVVEEQVLEEQNTMGQIVNIDEIEWPSKGTRESKYSAFDSVKVGQAVINLPKKVAEMVRYRLKRLGYTVAMSKLGDDNYGIKRLPDSK